ncbi:MAG: hypothetical protein HY554_11265, partial [Elusimicrobia bacterium]|nr:hypothetical protein [Elusimicrobiota bacterium]
MEEYDEEPAPRDRAATFFGFVLTACSGLSVLALGFGAAQVASSVLFPPEDLPQVEADVPVLRDAIGPSLGRAAASGRSPLESQAVSPALPGRPEAEPEPETLDGRPAQTAPRRVEAGFLETASRGGAPSTALSASPPPSFAGLADPVAPAPRIAGRAQPRPSRASEAPLSREPGEAPKREPAWRPRAAPGPTPPGVAHDQGRQQIERILASAGVPIGG